MFRQIVSLSRVALVIVAGLSLSACQDTAATIAAPSPSFARPVSLSAMNGNGNDKIKDQYIVVFRDNVSDVDGTAAAMVGKARGQLKHTFKSGLRGFAATMSDSDATDMAGNANVLYVEQDQVVSVGATKPTGTTTSTATKGGKTTTTTPTPTGTIVQKPVPSWGLDRVDQAALPMNTSYSYSATGAGVNVYIIDSGIRISHVEFGGRATADIDFVGDGYGATGCFWHGTHVAGTVGGVTAGVAKGVKLHSVRVLDCNGSGTVSNIVAGIDWVVANKVGAAVINLSIAGGTSTAEADAIARATAAGVVVVAAAGNNSLDACNYSPANVPSAITVGATNSGDQFASFSNGGSCVDIFAPGDAITSAGYTDNTTLQYASGTSMAAPHVAGAAALFLEKNPTATVAAVTTSLLQSATPGLIGALMVGSPNLLLKAQ